MRLRLSVILAGAVLCMAPATGSAALAPYSQDFEGLVQADPGALANDGWLVFGNVFNPDWTYDYGYGPFPAPNGGSAFSAVASGQGGPDQGVQQLSVYNDYNNGDHANGKFIEANVFQEQIIGAADVFNTWLFKFDAKRGNIGGDTTARAFIKTLDPNAGFALTNFIWVDMTNVPFTWGSYSLSIFIDPSLEGQILQFGFLSTTTYYQGSGVFYDNVDFLLGVDLDIRPGSCPNPICSKAKGVLPVAVLGTGGLDVSEIDVTTLQLEGVDPIRSGYEDVAGPFDGDLCGCTEAGPDGFVDLTLKFKLQDIVNAIGSLPIGDRTLTLTGALLDGTPLEGQDCVVILGCDGIGGSSPPGVSDTGGLPTIPVGTTSTSSQFGR
jgi:hypothetical protein